MNRNTFKFYLLSIIGFNYLLLIGCVKEQEFENCLIGTNVEFANICSGDNETTYRLWNYGSPTTVKKVSTTQRFFQTDSTRIIVTLYFNKNSYELYESMLSEHLTNSELFNNDKTSFSVTVECNGESYTNLKVNNWINYDYEVLSNLRMIDLRYNNSGNCSQNNKLSSIRFTLKGNLISESGKLLSLSDSEWQMQFKHN